MKYFSTFSGIGGFELGIEAAYVDSANRAKNRRGKATQKKRDRKRYQKIKGADAKRGRTGKHDHCGKPRQKPPACVGYSEVDKYAIEVYKRHFTHKNYGDIRTINPKELPDFDLLVGGFPCQAFSIAGKRKGFADIRGTLFFEITRIIREKQPRLLLLENVKGLLSHAEGETFYTIISALDELGYDLQWQVLNSKDYGVPQRRERVFIVGHLRETPRPKVFPISARTEELHQKPVPKSGGNGVQTLWKVGDSARRRRATLSRYTVRRLTPLECERLQGFPDRWTAGISDRQRYKTLGNAVTVNVVKEIITRLWEK